MGFVAFMTLVMKSIFKVLHFIIVLIANLLVYFGLWIPFVYLIICGILMLVGDLNISVMNTNTIIFYTGLALTLLGSLVITIRHLIIIPLNQFMDYRKAKKEFKEKQNEIKKQKLYEKNPAKYFMKYEGKLPHESHPAYTYNENERKQYAPPLVYRSRNNKNIIIHEYETHFDVFREYANGELQLIDVKEKPQNEKNTMKGKNAKHKKYKKFGK